MREAGELVEGELGHCRSHARSLFRNSSLSAKQKASELFKSNHKQNNSLAAYERPVKGVRSHAASLGRIAARRWTPSRGTCPLKGHVRRFRLLRNGFGLLLGSVELEDRLGSDLDDAMLGAVLLALAAP